jgi:hypothetical protein
VKPRWLLLAGAGVVIAWIIVAWIIPWPAHCSADDLAGCHVLGSVLLALFYGMPVVLLVLLSFGLPRVLASIARRLRSREHRQPR